jgi:Protein of unknown function (DUF1552)
MIDGGRISRRTVLRGIGTTMALPLLEAMLPAPALRAAGPTKAPLRMAFLYVPNGIHMPDWTPKTEGANFELPAILKPLAPFQHDLLVLTGLTADKARPNGDGPGDHARAASAFLTGCQPRKTGGADIKVGVSVDQFATARIGEKTRLPSLELGVERFQQVGVCDSGYACVYSTTISWRSPTTPMPIEVDPRQVFDRLFSSRPNDPEREQRNRLRSSVLDLVMDDARGLKNRLGGADQRKLDEYLSSVRELEQRIARSEKLPPLTPPPGTTKPVALPQDMQDHLRLMADLMVLAFRTDVTRIATFMLAREGSNRPYKFIGVSEGHHEVSHHQNDPAKQAKIRTINRFHIQQLAYLLRRLKETREGDGSLLDHCMLVYGSAIGDGNRHNHDNLPILVAGKGGGTLKAGRHLVYPRNTPVNNLWVSLLDRMGASIDKLGDSTGRLPGLDR